MLLRSPCWQSITCCRPRHPCGRSPSPRHSYHRNLTAVSSRVRIFPLLTSFRSHLRLLLLRASVVAPPGRARDARDTRQSGTSPCGGVGALYAPAVRVLNGKSFANKIPRGPPVTPCSRLAVCRAGGAGGDASGGQGCLTATCSWAGGAQCRAPCPAAPDVHLGRMEEAFVRQSGSLAEARLYFAALGITLKSPPASENLQSLFFPACK